MLIPERIAIADANHTRVTLQRCPDSGMLVVEVFALPADDSQPTLHLLSAFASPGSATVGTVLSEGKEQAILRIGSTWIHFPDEAAAKRMLHQIESLQ